METYEKMFDEEQKNNKTVINLTLIITGMFGFTLIYIGISIQNNFISPYWATFCSALQTLGQTLLVSVSLSFFLTIDVIRKYFLNLVKDMVLLDRYIEKVDLDTVNNIHNRCHKRLFHGIDIHKDEPLNNLTNEFHSIYTEPIYESYNENVDCVIANGNIIKTISSSYKIKNRNKRDNITIDAGIRYYCDVPDGVDPKKHFTIKSFKLIIDDKPQDIAVDVLSIKNDNASVKYNTIFNVIRKDTKDLKVLCNKSIQVDVTYTTMVKKSDVGYTRRLRYGVESFFLCFVCADKQYNLHPEFFGGFVKTSDINRNISENSVTVTCKKLSLPGSGAVIVLNKMK